MLIDKGKIKKLREFKKKDFLIYRLFLCNIEKLRKFNEKA